MANLLQRLFSRPQAAGVRPPRRRPSAPPLPPARFDVYRKADHQWDIDYEAIGRSRQRFWRRMGDLDAQPVDLHPALRYDSDRDWPTRRRRLQVVRRERTLILATDGLSDPVLSATGDAVGYGMEMFIETASPLPSRVQTPSPNAYLARSWAAEVLVFATVVEINGGGILDRIAEFGLVTSEAPNVAGRWTAAQLPPRFLHADGSLGLVFGVPALSVPQQITDTRHAPVTLVSVGLLTAAELDAARRNKRGFARALRQHLVTHGGHVVDFERPSFV